MDRSDFTFNKLKKIYQLAQDLGYHVITLDDFFSGRYKDPEKKLFVNRIDVDFEVRRVWKLLELYASLGIRGSFYFRLHARQYNLLSFENVRLVNKIIDSGHEIGLHSEIVDFSQICGGSARQCLEKDISIFENHFGIKMSGVASHGDYTGFNNLDFWKTNKPADFGLNYEAYDSKLWKNSFYISDSLIKTWKTYDNGVLLDTSLADPSGRICENRNVLYFLIHPFCFYENHFHE